MRQKNPNSKYRVPLSREQLAVRSYDDLTYRTDSWEIGPYVQRFVDALNEWHTDYEGHANWVRTLAEEGYLASWPEDWELPNLRAAKRSEPKDWQGEDSLTYALRISGLTRDQIRAHALDGQSVFYDVAGYRIRPRSATHASGRDHRAKPRGLYQRSMRHNLGRFQGDTDVFPAQGKVGRRFKAQ